MQDPSHASSDQLPPTPVRRDDTAVLDDPDAHADDVVRTAIGDSLGRYVVLEEVGRGGMGRVLRAYDPRLQREVALKEVRARLLGPTAARRLVAEARAMAKLAHPNVVAVYDVEELSLGRVVIVMEYVAGQTLTTWSATPHDWRETLACFRRAGRGLAAAHAAGLLHRDFKPDNVLIADAKVVKVTDFGLAKLTTDDSASASTVAHASGELSGSSSQAFTATGMVMGTPRYMAPEQHRGLALTPAADQYAYCVALWHALAGAPLFDEHGLEQLERAKAKGPPPWPTGQVPRPIADAIVRGLSPDPSRRWPSMDALLDALAFDPHARRRRWLQIAAGLGVVSVTALGVQAWASTRAQRCNESAAVTHLQGAWDDDVRAQVHGAVLGTGAGYAQGVWTRTERALDDYAASWTAMHVDACAATTVRGEQSTAIMDLRMACLHRAKVELAATTHVLAHADAKSVEQADALVGDLRPLERCADVLALQADVEPPLPAEAAAVDELRRHRAAATAARKAGHYDEARPEIDAAKAIAEGLEYLPARAELLVEDGTLLSRTGEYATSEAVLREGLQLALAGQQWDAVQDATAELLHVVGARQLRFAESTSYLDLAQGLAEDEPERAALLASHLAYVAHLQGKYEEGEAEARRALALQERALGPDHPDLALSHSSLATALVDQGRYAEAEAEAVRTIDLAERALGADHPTVAGYRHNLAGILHMAGKTVEAEAQFRRALAARLDAYGPDNVDVATGRQSLAIILNAQGKHEEAETEVRRALAALDPGHSDVALCRNTLAVILIAQGKFDEAADESRRVVALYEAALGPEHPNIATVRDNLGVILQRQGKYAEAETEHRRALAIALKVLGAEHPTVATARNNLGAALRGQGRLEAAELELRAALVLREKLLGTEHPMVALSRSRLAVTLFERGSVAEARALAELAWVSRQRDDVAATERAETAFVLARATWTDGAQADRRRAVELAERALADYTDAGAGYRDKAEAVRAWLAGHRA